MIYPNLFNYKNLIKMKNCEHITGAVLLNTLNSTQLDEIPHFSPDQACPNRKSDYYTGIDKYENCKYIEWNHGQGIFFNDWGDFPIFMVKDDESIHTLMDKCFFKYNQNIIEKFTNYKPLCSANMIFEMVAVKDKDTCIKRGELSHTLDSRLSIHCYEIGDANIWSLLNPTNKSKPLKALSIVLLVTRMDALTMFDQIAPAAESSALSIITLLLVAEALDRTNNEYFSKAENANASLDKNVMFVFFNGEAYDYLGSTKLIHDMNIRHEFPQKLNSDIINQSAIINTSHISHIIEIGQVGLASHSNYYIHTDPLSRNKHQVVDKEIKHMFELFSKSHAKISVKPVNDSNQPLPPSSLQNFLKSDDSIPGIYVADHLNEFANQFYHSILDDLNYVGSFHDHDHNSGLEILVNDIHGLSSTLANVVFKLIANNSADNEMLDIKINKSLIYDLVDCFLVNSSCEFWKPFSSYISGDLNTFLSYYVGADGAMRTYTFFTQATLAYLTMKNIDPNIKSKKECDDLNNEQSIYSYLWLNNLPSLNQSSVCVSSLAWAHVSSLSSSWVKSFSYSFASLRIYLRPDKLLDYALLAVGLSSTGLALVFGLFSTRYADTLFTTPADSRERESDTGAEIPTDYNPNAEPT
ncbi:nicastrin-like isoform X2 [Gordionus sp. m RMFG-2023]